MLVLENKRWDFIYIVFAVHKQRDVIPLDVNGDVGDSDDDNEHPVFDFEVCIYVVYC